MGRINGILGAHIVCDALTTEFNSINSRKEYLDNYDLLMIPGGVKALEKLRLEEGVVEFVKEWNKTNKTILSICNGAQLMITADILKGRTISGYYAIEADIKNAGATYNRNPVVIDKNIVSCPHYDFMGDWMREGINVYNNITNV